jgi:hypothetical protein
MIYYGCICGALAVLGPRVGGGVPRFLLGVAVGLTAAAVLPALRQATGF